MLLDQVLQRNPYLSLSSVRGMFLVPVLDDQPIILHPTFAATLQPLMRELILRHRVMDEQEV